jgi:hypothetical protein
MKRKNGSDGPGSLHIEGRGELLNRHLRFRERTGMRFKNELVAACEPG